MTATLQPDDALAWLLRTLGAAGYRFTTPTPVTHQRVLDRRAQSQRSEAIDLRDVFGWNLPFRASCVPADLLAALLKSGWVVSADGTLPSSETPEQLWKSTLRVSSLGEDLFVHSAFPTTAHDAVFFGPDTYRFARFIGQSLQNAPSNASSDAASVCRVLDIGCGSGAGGIAVARAMGSSCELVLNDINPHALRCAAANAAAAKVDVTWLPGDAMTEVSGLFDVIVANPPYLDDDQQRAYRHGGAHLGRDLSLRMTATALAHLAPGGCFLLYTGVAMVGGVDPFRLHLGPLLSGCDSDWTYSEIDPDVFGEELDRPVYADIDRIAVVGLSVWRSAAP